MPEEPLAERVQRAVDLLQGLPGRKRVTVVADADVDGTAAAAILSRALHEVGRRFTVVLTRRRDDRLVELVQERSPSFLITADLGASLVTRLSRLRIPTVVLDHHEPDGDGDGDGFIQVNPHLVGEDGSTGASGAAVSYLFAQHLLATHEKQSQRLLPYALLGAWGDRYHGASTDMGLHARLTQQARTIDAIEWRAWATDALPETPLVQALLENLDPMIPRWGGEKQQATKTLEQLRIDPGKPVGGLETEETARLASWMAASLLEEPADPQLVAMMLAPHPCFPAEGGPLAGQTIPEVALRVDAGTRQGAESTALAALLGHPDAWDQLEGGLRVYRQAVTGPIWKSDPAAITLGPGHLVRVEQGWSAGPVADRLMAWTRLGTQPVVAMGPAPRGLKLSLRARAGTPWRLDKIASECARAAGGVGGGHRLAAGALVPIDKEAQVLEAIAQAFKSSAAAGVRGPEVVS